MIPCDWPGFRLNWILNLNMKQSKVFMIQCDIVLTVPIERIC